MLTLDRIIGIFIPSTAENGRIISQSEHNDRIDLIALKFAGLFGGYQSFSHGIGGYIAHDQTLIKEVSTLILSWSTKESYNDHYLEVIDLASTLAKDWSQETIGIIDSNFHLHLIGHEVVERTLTIE
jgi:hypothetical protein